MLFLKTLQLLSTRFTSLDRFLLLWSIFFQFIGATMGSAELQIQTDNGLIGMPSNICCVVVEYLAGGTLKSYLIRNRRRKLAFKVVVQLGLDLARGYFLSLFSFGVCVFCHYWNSPYYFNIVSWHFK